MQGGRVEGDRKACERGAGVSAICGHFWQVERFPFSPMSPSFQLVPDTSPAPLGPPFVPWKLLPWPFPIAKGECSIGPSYFLFFLSCSISCCFRSGILSPPPGPISSFHESACGWGWVVRKVRPGDTAPWLNERQCSSLVLTKDTSGRGTTPIPVTNNCCPY